MKLWRTRADDIDEEMATHLAMAIQDRIARGESPEQARQAAMREFGNPLLVRETTRGMWGGEWMERIAQDIRYAWRQMMRSPGFSATVIFTLALGLGATLAMFTVVERVMLQALPFHEERRLVTVTESGRKGDQPYIPWADIQEWRQRSKSFAEIGFTTSAMGRSFIEGDNGAQQVMHLTVSSNLFHLLGVEAARGRGFDGISSEESAGNANEQTAVLSDAVWRDLFGARADIVGRVVKISGNSYTVMGVMPRGFTFPVQDHAMAVWTPIVLKDVDRTRENAAQRYSVIARLRKGASVQDAGAEMKVVQAGVAKLYTDAYTRDLVTTASVQRYRDSLVRPNVRRVLLSLFAAASLLWVIACVNVTGLLLSRASVRQREIAVRGALGASRRRIVQQLLLEGILLSAGGSVLGLLLAVGLLKLFSHGLLLQLNISNVMPDFRSVAALMGMTAVSAISAALWPALASARAPIEPALRQSAGQAGPSRTQHKVRSLLVVTQIAMSLVLLVSCGLLLRTIYALRQVPLGFRTDNIIVGRMAVPSYRFADQDMNQRLYTPLLARVRSLPGVESATLMSEVPLGHNFNMVFSFSADGNSADAVKRRDLRAQFRTVGPDAQKVFGFRMWKGRYFNEHDTAGSPAVVVVNRAFVHEYSASNDPNKVIGQRIMNFEKDRPATVIGVLDDTRQVGVADQSAPEVEVYLPQLTPQNGLYKSAEGIAMSIAIRTGRSFSSLIPELRPLMTAASPELAETKFTTMTEIVEDSYGSQQLVARLLILFGGSALLLCLSGLYGLLSQLVTQRTREIGVRVALGARRGQVVGLVLRQAGRMLLFGSLTGLVLAWFAARLVSSFLYGVTAHDGLTMAATALLLVLSGVAAAWVPAARAAGIDPVEALRAE
ncbi:MAG: ABC transporter permease [Edaphobacter sp.]|uniref:ABC transporter permease n=1 Tax=Edaphobacter sp. TaxID=1934404 RepID=UPI0023A29F18|nr:ABC transporter permease [Edaphobacter sp.]MDE1178557.1 ABC transporter permease [Edaphobacter sp.]